MLIESLEGRVLLSGGAARFATRLTGAEEVPANQTRAVGAATFTLSKDGSTLRYRLSAKRIVHTMGAHIHLAQPGVDGPIVVDLLASGRPRMGRKGVSVRGTITAAQLTGTLAGHSISELVSQMLAGGAYVNVHTDDGVDPPNTGPGDFPGGEIRGQLHRLGKRFAQGGQTTSTGGQTGGTGSPTGGTGGQTGGTGYTVGQTGGIGGQTGGAGTGYTGGTGYYNY